MLTKRIFSCLMVGLILVIGMFTALKAVGHGYLPSSVQDIGDWADHAVKLQLKDFDRLEQLAPAMLLAGGAKEQDGIFITKNYLLENIAPEDSTVLEQNLTGIEGFLKTHNIPATFLLIPTACAIKQQDIPARAQLYNQKALIAKCYARLSGKAGTTDAYSKLFSAKEQYTYFRTESNLTGLGGYYVYTALAPRMGYTSRALDQFEVEQLANDYYGTLYQRSSYKGTDPDLLTLYRFSRYSRQYQLSLTNNGERKNYYSLFPTHLAQLGQPKSVVLGGFGQRMDISAVSPFEESLLIFADDTALSYLPFLVVHYGNITMVDLQNCPDDMLASLVANDYDQVLFAYSVDHFIHEPVAVRASFLQ
ncbi:DHHW family protein [Oscillospiraceae bacterium LTW-04]|nr:DHHW family protein [Oscillospiraceae bacterium MB24-C1]